MRLTYISNYLCIYYIFYITGHNQYISASDADSFSSKSQPAWHSSNLSQSSSDCDTRSTPPLTQKGHSRRNMGGRKPTKDLNCSPEEEERRRIRRERNKAAAARCRKRRVDHTNSLITVSFLFYRGLHISR